MFPIHFHPAVTEWFSEALGPATECQLEAWASIAAGHPTLVCAPTGSGKTLAAFLHGVNALIERSQDAPLPEETYIVYVSPLKALGNDIAKNLDQPLRAIDARLAGEGPAPRGEDAAEIPPTGDAVRDPSLAGALTTARASGIRTQVRTGDTPPAARQAMRHHPPHILVTTPESLYILLTSQGGREMLASARTVIVDEIHALVNTKRGAHLALSLERLDALAGQPLQRIGLSATVRPIESVAQFLTGAGPAVRIIDAGHQRERDLDLLLAPAPLEAVMSAEVWETLYARLAAEIEAHRTTLVFTNTRRLAERVARHLTEHTAHALGTDAIAAHHGSLSRELRLDAEQRLKDGQLRALVATASLELGIDVGEVDLVIQIGSPRSIGTFLQRVGRSGHGVERTPKGRLVPLSRDDLVECVALLGEVRRGHLDRLAMCTGSLDVLAQHLVSASASAPWRTDDLLALARRAHPYRALSRDSFEAVVSMLATGFSTRRGRRGAYLHHDAVNGVIRARKHARLTALTAGGAIPEMADYAVILEPGETPIGTLNEDFAIESLPGDVFVLGTHSWRILRVEPGKVQVEDANGQPPSLPFWLGEAPARSDELSCAVSSLRERASAFLQRLAPPTSNRPGSKPIESAVTTSPPEAARESSGEARTGRSATPLAANLAAAAATGADNEIHPHLAALRDHLAESEHLGPDAADELANYLYLAHHALGRLPTQSAPCVERFFDEAGGMQLVIHAPYGARLNRAWGLALRKRFCRRFNFELQAAASDDSIVLSLGETHSFPLTDVAKMLHPNNVREVLEQAVLASPMFTARWRWNANISLAVPRWAGGKKVPAPIQRMQAEDLIAVVFPDQIACAENLAGEREIPDHPLVEQTLDDALHEGMDLEALRAHLELVRSGERSVHTIDTTTASPMAAEILNAKPYAFLDDAPLEERRTQAVISRRWLDPAQAEDIGRLEPEAIERVRAEVAPNLSDIEEVHDALLCLGVMTGEELSAIDLTPLITSGRAIRMQLAGGERWCATERAGEMVAIHPAAERVPPRPLPERFSAPLEPEQAMGSLLRSRLEHAGPTTVRELAHALAVDPQRIDAPLLALESEGFALRGQFELRAITGDRGLDDGHQWCERRLLARIHRYTVARLRREIEPVSATDFMRFLFRWQGLESGYQRSGPEGLEVVLAQLEGVEASAAGWERDLLPGRVAHYRGEWLDALCLSGQLARLRRGEANPGQGAKAALALVARDDLDLWALEAKDACDRSMACSPIARRVLEGLDARGPCFFPELLEATQLARFQLEDALGELIGAGLASADAFAGVRSLAAPAKRSGRRGRRVDVRPEYRHAGIGLGPPRRRRQTGGGRWATVPRRSLTDLDPRARERFIELIAATLLRRYGVVFKRLLERESLPISWRELASCYRRLEARGEIRGGRFVNRFSGEQFAHPDALTMLRAVRRRPDPEATVSISALDPLNLVGILTPGERIPARASNRVLFRGGVPVTAEVGGQARALGHCGGPGGNAENPSEPTQSELDWPTIGRLRRQADRR